MYDIELVREILRQVLCSAQTIAKRFAPITSPEDFVSSEEGLEKLDAICMQLIAIGESVKSPPDIRFQPTAAEGGAGESQAVSPLYSLLLARAHR